MATTTALNPADFQQIYSGLEGRCCCGCAGKHTYSDKVAGRGKEVRGYDFDDGDVNERTFKMMLGKIGRLIADGLPSDDCAQYISVQNGNRIYVAYRTPQAREAWEAHAASLAIDEATVERLAAEMLAQIQQMKADGLVPKRVRDFGELHDYFDANVGWGDEIDGLSLDDWVTLQNRVHELMQKGEAK